MKRTVGNNEWLDIDVLDDYLEGKLDASMMHKVERISLDDPFVAQALEGLSAAKKRTQTFSLLQKQLQERVAQKPVERKMWRITSHRLSIAATAAVLFITVGVLFWLRESNRRQQLEMASNRPKQIEVNIKPEAAAVAPTDTLTTPKPATLVDQQKVEQALNNTLSKGNQAIAKNNTPRETIVESASLENKEVVKARLTKDNSENQAKMLGARIAAPVAPVQALESRVDGIQVKTDPYARSVKGTVYDINGRPLPGVDVKMVGDDLRSITNMSGEFNLPINKDSNKVTLEVASLGFARKNIEAKPNEQTNIRLEASSSALNEVVVVKSKNVAKKMAAKDEVVIGMPAIGWKAYSEYLIKENKLYVDGAKSVVLSFDILKNGAPDNIKIEKSGGKSLDDEAIRLLKDGSKWNYPASVNKNTSVTIKF
ncbi:carboxypeptidase-like regulatory domain-containing protein [Pedobacter ureilyticus]|uniref:Carboxypeptidase-like regulatory domain-containing protein n=1 Tax=Pedobacter ureilyticus TaxID=1393051 RepID=A0ABW9J5P0_9SPHI|nr:carboxypeptidase-like regulatory domain-containing protein [Pedobacter helvus]